MDEETALSGHATARCKTFEHLDHATIGQPDLDPPQLNRLLIVFVAHHPDASSFALVNDGVARYRDRVVTFADEDLHTREHFRLEQPGHVVDPPPHPHPPHR